MFGNFGSDRSSSPPEEQPHHVGGRSLRIPLSGVLALVGSVAIAAGFVGFLFKATSGTAGYVSTRIGEQRSIKLADGSVIMLNTDSGLQMHTAGARLRIEVFRGEVLFDMKPNPSRHLVVSAGGLNISDTATIFAVQVVENGRIKVTVQEGKVELSGGHMEPFPLEENQQALADNEATLVSVNKAVAPEEIARQLSWRDGILEFQQCTRLSDVAVELNRYNLIKIEVDAQIADLTLGGTFETPSGRFADKLRHVDPRIRSQMTRNGRGESVLKLFKAPHVPPGVPTPENCKQ
jgi:transmembrane sensor